MYKLPSAKQVASTLEAVEKRRGIITSAITQVAQRYSPASFIWGPPGIGKSHTVTTTLDALLQKKWTHHTGYATPKALMIAIVNDPQGVHLFEDCERMLKVDLSASILRAACGAPNDRERLVTYETFNEKLSVKFTGGIIIVTNENPASRSGPLQGVASRFRPLKWDMSFDERVAMITSIASYPIQVGTTIITATEATKVARELISLAMENQAQTPLDIRLFTEHALASYIAMKNNPNTTWQDVLLSKISGTTATVSQSQAQRTQSLQQLASRINSEGGSTKVKVEKWKTLTGLGQAIFYRHLKATKK